MVMRDFDTLWDRKTYISIKENFKELFNYYIKSGLDAAEAREKAIQAVADAEIAKETAETTREEMLAIIREQTQNGDLAPEIAQARQGKETLGENLNSIKSELAQTTGELGDLAPEIAQARQGKATLGENLNSIKSELAQIDDDLEERGINAKRPKYPLVGLKLDGATDDSQHLQNIINYADSNGINEIYIPSGTLRLTKEISVPSNITISGAGTRTIIKAETSVAFRIRGSIGNEINLTENASLGTTSLTLESTTELSEGDTLLLLSQRAANTDDAGDLWRLGTSTPNVDSPVFGEFVKIKTINGNIVDLRSGLTFPSYRIDNLEETSTHARERSTVQLVNTVKNVTIKNMTFEGDNQLLLTFISTQYAENCTIENIIFKPSNNATCVNFRESLNCEGRHLSAYFEPTTVANPYYQRNAFKCTSSQYCGFERVYVENGSQSFDITYTAKSLPSIKCYVRNCKTKGSTNNPFTSHGGTYAVYVVNNIFEECERSGIAIRSRNSIVMGNVITGSLINDTFGIYLFDGWARDCIVSNNQINMFDHAITVRDGNPDRDGLFEWVGATIVNNTISNSRTGIRLHRWPNREIFKGATGILIEHNNFSSTTTSTTGFGVEIAEYYCDVKIIGNVFRLHGLGQRGIESLANTNLITFRDNDIHDARQSTIRMVSPTDETVAGILYTENNKVFVDGLLTQEEAVGSTSGTQRLGATTSGIKFKDAGATSEENGMVRWNEYYKKLQVYVDGWVDLH